MNPKVYSLSKQQSIHLLAELLSEESWAFSYDAQKHGIIASDKKTATKLFDLRLPLLCNSPQKAKSLPEYLEELQGEDIQHYVLLMMQAGQASLGSFVDGELTKHKVIRKYMVRKKQGKAQLNHLNTKGKSRQGSRIRLRESLEFFVELNQKMKDWQALPEAEAIFYSASPQLWPYLFESTESCPFAKDDPRLRKVPVDVNVPNLAELKRINWSLSQGQLLLFEKGIQVEIEKALKES
mgnify:CR=1 FL=1